MRFFSSKELYVLASLLGMEFLIGVEGNTFENNRAELRTLFRESYSQLEAKGIVDYKIDGTLYIDRDVRDIVELLNMADTVYLVATDHSGKLEKDNYLCRNNICCCLSETRSGYSVRKIDSIDTAVVLKEHNISWSKNTLAKMDVLLDDIRKLDGMYKSFNGMEADDYLAELVVDNDIRDLIRDCLIKKNDVFVMKKFVRKGSLLEMKEELILRFVKDCILSFSLIDIETVSITIYKGA